MKLGKLMIFVTDLAVAKQFYGDVLGFQLKSEDERSLEFEHEGCDLIAFKCRQNASIDNYSEVARYFVFSRLRETCEPGNSMSDMDSRSSAMASKSSGS